MKNISSLNSYNTIDYIKLYQQFSPKSECKQKSLIKMKKYCEPYVLGIIFFFLITVILMLKKKWLCICKSLRCLCCWETNAKSELMWNSQCEHSGRLQGCIFSQTIKYFMAWTFIHLIKWRGSWIYYQFANGDKLGAS